MSYSPKLILNSKMSSALLELLAINSPFTDLEIWQVWMAFESLDVVITAIEHARATGQSQLMLAARQVALPRNRILPGANHGWTL